MTDENVLDYSLLDHTADMGLEIEASDPAGLFKKAGKALIHIMFGAIHSKGADTMKVSLIGNDLPDLMVRWLTEILYLFEGEHLVTTDIIIDSLSSSTIDATLTTSAFDPLRYEILREIKAVTYHQIAITQKEGVWRARVIFDL
jgi:SHS2 domain-containing protein